VRYGRSPFAVAEQARQDVFRASSDTFTKVGREPGLYRGAPHAAYLCAGAWYENLFPEIRVEALEYFARHDIAWHSDANHVRSSQVCCINFFMPLRRSEPALIAALEPALGPITKIIPIENRDLVAFEWIGEADYLNEGIGPLHQRRRGEHCTSADAAVRLERPDGSIETVLIEWKYTETYSSVTQNERRRERLQRYGKIAFWPDGPLRRDLGLRLDQLFYEPVYQLFRLQALARQIETTGDGGRTRACVLYISPDANADVRRITAPALMAHGRDLFIVWPSLLVDPSRFVYASADALFAGAVRSAVPDLAAWQDYESARYAGIFNGVRISRAVSC